jgi:GntR family transcriptional regulator, transcriptional repressor for pyruvate dehydrogenase complex
MPGRAGPSPIVPVHHQPVHELVADQLRRAIHMGSYVADDKLPPERELAARLKVSRMSVREATRVLVRQGYVERRRGSKGGIVVLDRGLDDERLALVIKSMMPTLQQVFEFRRAVESEAARLAAMRRTRRNISALESAYKGMEKGLETRRFRAADSAFHLGIADAAGNEWMRMAIENARAAVWIPLDPLTDRVFRSAQFHHEQILTAIKDQDADEAARLASEHIDFTLADLCRTADGPVKRVARSGRVTRNGGNESPQLALP